MGFKEKKKDITKMSGDIVDRLNEKYKKQVVFTAKKAPHRPKYKIPFTSLTLNRLTAGGFTVPRMSQLYGPSSVYKSTGIYDLIMQAQRLQKEQPKLVGRGPSGSIRKIALIDAEKSLNVTFLKNCGVNVDSPDFVIIDNFDSADELIDIMVDMFASDEFMLICLDSLTVLLTQREQDTDAQDMIKLQGWQGKFTSNLFRKIHNANKGNTAFVFVNQIRDTLGDKVGRARNAETGYAPTGGHGPVFYSSDILELSHYMGEFAPGYEDIPAPGGKYSRKPFQSWTISARVEKTRSSGQDNRELFFRFIPKLGSIDRAAEIINLAQMDGIIINKGAHYYHIDAKGKEHKIGQGMEKVRIALASDEKLQKAIVEQIEAISRSLGGGE